LSGFKRNISYVYITNAINGILGILLVPLCIKMMGTNGYGLFSIYAVIAGYLALVDLGVSKNLLRLLSAKCDIDVKTNDLRTALGIYVIICLLLIASVPLLLTVIPKYVFPVALEDLIPLRLIIMLSVVEYVLTVPVLLLQNYSISNEKFDSFSRFTLVTGIYRYILLFLGVYVFGTPVAIVAIMAFRRIIDCCAAHRIMGGLPRGAWRPLFDLRASKAIVRLSSALTFAQFFQSSIIAMGSFLVNRHFGLSGLGIYRAVFDLVNKIWFISNGLALVLFPKFTKMLTSAASRRKLYPIVVATLCLSWAGYCLLSVAGGLGASVITGLLGLKQPEMPSMFALLLLGISINAHTSLSYEFLQAAGRYRLVALLSLVTLVCMYVSFAVLLPSCGLYAISWAWIISQLIYCLLADAMTMNEIYAGASSQFRLAAGKALMLAMPLGALFSGRLPAARTVDIAAGILSVAVFGFVCAEFKRQYTQYQRSLLS